MDLLHGNVKSVYFKYLGAAFGSSLISCIYSLVDMAMVGQYHGPIGSAAMGVVTPIYNIIYSLGFLTGIGGSVLYSSEKGKIGKGRENEYFSASLFFTIMLSAVCWIGGQLLIMNCLHYLEQMKAFYHWQKIIFGQLKLYFLYLCLTK